VVRELSGDGCEPGVRARFEEAVGVLRGLGAHVVEVSCPHFSYALPAYYLIAPSECSSNLARFDGMRYGLRVADGGEAGPTGQPGLAGQPGQPGEAGAEEVMSRTRGAGFGPEVKRRIMLGAYALSSGYYDAYYGQAQKVRTLVARDFAAAYEQVDVLVSPTTPTVAFGLGEKVDDPVEMYLSDLCTIPSSLAGGPAMSVPAGLSDGLPVGFQIMAPAFADDRLYRVGAALEAALDEARGHPFLAEAPVL
jgi:aspartyl-tRNA(Asn)/glutamyl-tRNA(Gln) amidotransferase subunit A